MYGDDQELEAETDYMSDTKPNAKPLNLFFTDQINEDSFDDPQDRKLKNRLKKYGE